MFSRHPARTSFGSVAYGALGAGVESPTVLGAARLRALGLSTPARSYGSLSAVHVGTVELGGPSPFVLVGGKQQDPGAGFAGVPLSCWPH